KLQKLVAGDPLHHDRFKAGRGDQGGRKTVLVPTLNPTLLVLLARRVQIEQPAIDPAWNLSEPKGNSGPFGFVKQLIETLLELGGDRPTMLPLILALLDRDPLLQLVDLIEKIGVERHPNSVSARLPESLDLLPGGRIGHEPLGHMWSPGSWCGGAVRADPGRSRRHPHDLTNAVRVRCGGAGASRTGRCRGQGTPRRPALHD